MTRPFARIRKWQNIPDPRDANDAKNFSCADALILSTVVLKSGKVVIGYGAKDLTHFQCLVLYCAGVA